MDALEAAQRRIAELEAALAARDLRILELEAGVTARDLRLAHLEGQVRELLERLNRNSGNSNKPPSSDSPASRELRRMKGGKGSGGNKNKRGGQPGHKGATRDLVPADQVDHVVNLFPPTCESCHKALPEEADASATRYQTVEMPPIKPVTTEYRVHAVSCPGCGFRTCAAHDQVPLSPFGPRLSAVVALLTGVYHLSRRSAVTLLQDVMGVTVSLGAVSTIEDRVSVAVEPAVAEAWEKAVAAPVKHTDGTGWSQGGSYRALWTIATAAVTVFKIIANARMETLRALLGEASNGILVSDRATALAFWAMKQRQVCWAHLLRKFISFSEMGGGAGEVGQELLEYMGIMFAYWDDIKTGKLARSEFRTRMDPVRKQVEACLERAVSLKLPTLSGSCADILAHRLALWTFVDRDDVEPTNNHAERELRAFVLWRKRSFGTQSDRGNSFAERLMTVAHTARKQGVNVLAFLVASCTAKRDGAKGPSLFQNSAV